MHFRRVGSNAAESSSGVRVERTGRSEIRYFEGGKTAVVEVEPGDPLAVYVSAVTSWLPPNESSPFTALESARLAANVAGALKLLGIEFVLV